MKSVYQQRYFFTTHRKNSIITAFLLLMFLSVLPGLVPCCHALSSSNIPLGSPVYQYLEKLSGMGLIISDVRGLKPFSRAEAARLTLEAEQALSSPESSAPPFARDIINRLRATIPRELSLRNQGSHARALDFNPLLSARMRYVYLDGVPRSYERTSHDPAHQSAFGFIGGDLRPLGGGGSVNVTGTEGTPLLENNNGSVHPPGNSAELRFTTEGYLSRYATLLVEPKLMMAEKNSRMSLEKGYLTIGSGGLALEVGRDENWFGPGYRGTTLLTNNAQNFDLIKLWSPEPLDVDWVKTYLGTFKYALVVSRFDQTGSGDSLRRPYFLGFKLAVKPKEWFEYGLNFVRQQGGPGFTTPAKLSDEIFGGGDTNHNNTIAGLDLRFRIPQLRNSEVYVEYSGEDNAGGVWPIVESYVAGFFVPCLTTSCRDDFRFEYFFGSVMLYGDWKFPAGYVYHDMTPGHSQGGGGVQEFFGRYVHWFGVRNSVALEYFYTERGRSYRTGDQAMESKHAGRFFWSLPLYGDIDGQISYGIEKIGNLNLVYGHERTNQIMSLELRYRY